MNILSQLFNKKDSEQQKNLSHVNNLLKIAMVDGTLDEVEYNLVLSIAKKYNISEEDVHGIRVDLTRRIDSKKIKFVKPKSYQDRFHQFYDLVSMMMIDGTIDDREFALCSKFAKNLGFESNHLQELITLIGDNAKKGRSSKETLKKYQTLTH